MAEFHNLEEHLKDFITGDQKDSHNSVSTNYYKYNNLRISMDSKKYSQPHFIVRLGISEAAFSLEDCEKISGGLGPDERSVYRWFDRAHVKELLFDIWKEISKPATIDMTEMKD